MQQEQGRTGSAACSARPLRPRWPGSCGRVWGV